MIKVDCRLSFKLKANYLFSCDESNHQIATKQYKSHSNTSPKMSSPSTTAQQPIEDNNLEAVE